MATLYDFLKSATIDEICDAAVANYETLSPIQELLDASYDVDFEPICGWCDNCLRGFVYEDEWMNGECTYKGPCPHGIDRKEVIKNNIRDILNSPFEAP